MALTDNLVSYWKLDEASGNALDAHSTHDLTDANTVGSDAGKVGNGRLFTAASSERFSAADNADLSLGADTDFYIAGWFFLNSLGSQSIIVNKGQVNATGDEFLVWVVNGLQLYVGNGSSFQNTQTGVTLDVDTWYFFEAWHDSAANQIGVCLNRGSDATASWSGGTQDTANAFSLGSNSAGSANFLDGILDEVYFRKGSIPTTGERDELYNGGDGLSYDDFAGGGLTHYTLTAEVGVFTLTGQDADLRVARKLTADVGSYSLTGQDASLTVARKLSAEAGSFSLSGQDASLTVARRLTAEAGEYLLTGQDASLIVSRRLSAEAGTFVLTGGEATLTHAGAGAFKPFWANQANTLLA